jgi:hypothetical protein
MFWSSFDCANWSPQQLGIGGGSSETPALAAFGTHLYAIWKGAGGDQRMFWSRFDGNSWSPQQDGVGGGTSGRPALAAFQGRLYAAWKGVGGDDRMFWSRITVDRLPLRPVLLEPTPGQQNVPIRPQLRWSDPGVGTVRAAESFLVLVATTAHPSYDMWFVRDVTARTDYAVGVDLSGSTNCIWQITGFNGVGTPDQLSGPAADGSFSTAAGPSRPPSSTPLPPSQPTCQVALDTDAQPTGSETTMRVSGSGFKPLEKVEIVEGTAVLESTQANQFGFYGVSVGFLTGTTPRMHKVFARGVSSGLVSNEASFSV